MLLLLAATVQTFVDGGGGWDCAGGHNFFSRGGKTVGRVRGVRRNAYEEFRRIIGGRGHGDTGAGLPGLLEDAEPVHYGGELGLPLLDFLLELDDAFALTLAGGGRRVTVALAALFAAPGGRLLLGHGNLGLVPVLRLLGGGAALGRFGWGSRRRRRRRFLGHLGCPASGGIFIWF